MANKDGSDLPFMAVHSVTGSEMYDAFVGKVLDRKSRLDIPTTSNQEGEENKPNSSAVVDVNEGNNSPALNFRRLPSYLRSCFMYCCIFSSYGQKLSKRKLVLLFVAEDLIHERPGEIMEDIAEENIEKLVELGMLQEEIGEKIVYKVSIQYRGISLRQIEKENFVAICASSSNIRVVIWDENKITPHNLGNLPIGSLFVFETESLSSTYLEHLFCGVKFLRVLELETVNVEFLPEEVGNLIHLRYLGLKRSGLREIPESLSNLQNLQTLDIRWCGLLTLPSGVLDLLQLRHLKISSDMGDITVPDGIGRLTNLQTFTRFSASNGIASELRNLTQLRELGVSVSEENATELFDSIMKIESLLSLILEVETAYSLEKQFNGIEIPFSSLGLFSPPPLLRKLCLHGALVEIPDWLGSMENLTKLHLSSSHLSDNPPSVLQLLPNLKHLTLWHAYEVKQIGREFCGAGGFPKLEALVITSDSLIEWTELEDGAFPSLKYLGLKCCYRLRFIPEGLQGITTLQKLELSLSHPDLARRLCSKGAIDYYKIKHIPLLNISTLPAKYCSKLD